MCMSYQLQQGPLSHSLALSSHHIIHRDWLRAQHAMLAHSLTHTPAHSLRLNRRVRAHSLTHSQIPVHIPTQWPVLYWALFSSALATLYFILIIFYFCCLHFLGPKTCGSASAEREKESRSAKESKCSEWEPKQRSLSSFFVLVLFCVFFLFLLLLIDFP